MSTPKIKIAVSQADATLVQTTTLTANMAGTPIVKFSFTDEWEGLGKTVVFRAGSVCIADQVLNSNNEIVVPSECLAEAGVNLIIGVYGANSSVVIPTVWCSCGEILDGTDYEEAENIGTPTAELVETMSGYVEAVRDAAQTLEDYAIRLVNVDDEHAGDYGEADVQASLSGSGENRTLNLTFSNLKGNGIESVDFNELNANRGRLVITTSDGQEAQFDGLKDALDVAETITNESKADALIAEGYAVGTQDGEDPPGNPYHNHNAQYYSQLANIDAGRADTFAEMSATNYLKSETNALKAEGYAVGEQDGTEVQSGTYFENNAKYYALQASGSATSADGRARDAAGSASDASESAVAAAGSATTAASLVSTLQPAVDIMNGDQEINLTPFTGTVTVNGATAEYSNGKLVMYNQISGVRYLLCLNGQIDVKSSSAELTKTVPAGIYKVHISASGNVPEEFVPRVSYTKTTFNDASSAYDGDTITATEPITIAFRVPNNTNFGTQENPTVIDLYLTYYAEKENKHTRVLPTYADLAKLFTGGVLTEGEYTLKGFTSEDSPIMLKMSAKYTGDTAPYMMFESRTESKGRLYFSHNYEIESKAEYKLQEWRIPNNFATDYISIIITVPADSTLSVKSFSCKYSAEVPYNNPQIIFHAHRGLERFWPSETYNSVVAAAEIGFGSCIVIPKFTSDNVAVCFHNDGGSSSPLSAYLTLPNGNPVPALEDTSKKISDFTYAELMDWSMGACKASVYADEKILKMDDFLRICANTGMRPIFSIHPTLTVDQWTALKVLLDKYNLSSKLSVKDGTTTTWDRVIQVFGDGNIYSIICLSSSAIDAVTKINNWRTSSGATKTRVDVEWKDFDPNDEDYVTRTAEAKAAGLVVSAVLDTQHTGNYMKQCFDNGITEFTNYKHCSMGLNW